jgi:hypothetical protein
LKYLGLQWTDEEHTLRKFFEYLDINKEKEDRGYLELEEIAISILDNVPSDIVDFENQYLD